jgi:hypothetical protein
MHDQALIYRVSSHAVIRYLERVLELPVDAWLKGKESLGEHIKAAHVCECAGLPVDAVRLSMLIDPVVKAMRSKSSQKAKVVTRDAIYVISDGNLITVLAPQMQAYRKVKYKAHKSRRLEEV